MSTMRTMKYHAALAADAATVLDAAFEKMISSNAKVFESALGDGGVYNNGTNGIDCDEEPIQSWMLGDEIMKTMREVETKDPINTTFHIIVRVYNICSGHKTST